MKVVTAAILLNHGDLLIAQRPAGDSLAGFWELPGGKVEEGETNEVCLARELDEELGIVVDVGPLFGRSRYDYEHGTIELVAYRVWHRNGQIAPTFHSDVRFVSKADLRKFAFAPADIPLICALKAGWPDNDND